MFTVLRRVFKSPRYSMLAFAVAFIVLSFSLLLPNKEAVWQVFSSEVVVTSTKFFFLGSLYGSLFTNFTLISGLYLVVVSVLFGINIALLTYYIRKRQVAMSDKKASLTSAAGIISAMFGVGCAACGSVILTSLFGIFGAGGLLLRLPFHGIEFGVLGLILIIFSTYYLIRRIRDPLVCPV